MDIVEGADPPLRWLALDAAAVGDIDFSGADSVSQVRDELERRGGKLVVCAIDPAVRKLLDAYGLTEKFGEANIFATASDVVAAYQNEFAGPPTAAGPQPA